jgi:hypothetical protein
MLALRRSFSTSSLSTSRVHDSEAFINSISGKDCVNEKKALAVNSMIESLMNKVGSEISKDYVTQFDYDRQLHDHNTGMSRLKNELQMIRIKEFVQSKNLLDQVHRELLLGRQRSKESLGMIRSEMKLDLSLEKGRQRDAQSNINMKIHNLRSKYESEATNCRSNIQKIRQETVYSLLGYLFTSVAAFLGYLRLLS